MHTSIDQNVDERIHRFMAKKSPLWTLSMTIADKLPLARHLRKAPHDNAISYERTKWNGNGRRLASGS